MARSASPTSSRICSARASFPLRSFPSTPTRWRARRGGGGSDRRCRRRDPRLAGGDSRLAGHHRRSARREGDRAWLQGETARPDDPAHADPLSWCRPVRAWCVVPGHPEQPSAILPLVRGPRRLEHRDDRRAPRVRAASRPGGSRRHRVVGVGRRRGARVVRAAADGVPSPGSAALPTRPRLPARSTGHAQLRARCSRAAAWCR